MVYTYKKLIFKKINIYFVSYISIFYFNSYASWMAIVLLQRNNIQYAQHCDILNLDHKRAHNKSVEIVFAVRVATVGEIFN